MSLCEGVWYFWRVQKTNFVLHLPLFDCMQYIDRMHFMCHDCELQTTDYSKDTWIKHVKIVCIYVYSDDIYENVFPVFEISVAQSYSMKTYCGFNIKPSLRISVYRTCPELQRKDAETWAFVMFWRPDRGHRESISGFYRLPIVLPWNSIGLSRWY